MLLSILTPSIPRRAQKLATLAEDLRPWLGDEIEWLVITDGRPSGPKRNEMMDAARGQYVMHLDDDDRLAANFPELILPALRLGVDLVMFDALASLNGSPQFRVITGIDHPNEQPRHLPGGRFSDIRRREWHWCCWRTEFACTARFPNEHRGDEDAYWLKQLWDRPKTWHKIPHPLFLHFYDSRDSAFSSN